RPDEDLGAEVNRSGVQEHAIRVDEGVVADRDVPAVVAEERRLDPDARADAAEELDEGVVAPGAVGGGQRRERGEQAARAMREREKLRIPRVVDLAREHALALRESHCLSTADAMRD